MDVSPYIDNANCDLWNAFSSRFNISVEYGIEKYCECHLEQNNFTIYVPWNDKPSPDSLTHELLHLYLPSKNIRIGDDMESMFRNQYPHCLIFDKELYDHISNCLEHVKMLPVFLKMGYSCESFLYDYHDCKFTYSEVVYIKFFYKSGIFKVRVNTKSVRYYIAKFFAAKADVNPKNNYIKQLQRLQKIDSVLYSILDTFWDDWMKYDIESPRDILEDDYHQLISNLNEGIIKWGENKKFNYCW
ncbi:MAG: hypothetical protein II975_02475 [Bacteroidales bacterium]|nr:hypothetical protein [Bacteroidales bacterium]